jgi:hypothetical protein
MRPLAGGRVSLGRHHRPLWRRASRARSRTGFGLRWAAYLAFSAFAVLSGSPGPLQLGGQPAGASTSSANSVVADGSVLNFGKAANLGSMGGQSLKDPVVGMAATPTGGGYWEVASDGGIFTFGKAAYDGSMGGKPLAAPIVGMAATPTGGGYWEVASDGGIFTFGTAAYDGSMGGKPLAAPIVGMAATPTGGGYWEVGADGGIFTFGTAAYDGSMGGQSLKVPIAGMAASPTGAGYWEVATAPAPATPAPSGGGVALPLPRQYLTGGTVDQGVDYAAPGGTPLYAMGSGVIIGEGITGFGPNAPVLQITSGPLAGKSVYYGHAGPDLVPVGAHVVAGQQISIVGYGIVGISTGPHLEIGYYPCGPMGAGAAMLQTIDQLVGYSTGS